MWIVKLALKSPDAGRTRMRPVLMTAAAMIIGMLPVSLGLEEGGEQKTHSGRAVVGDLFVTTLITLLLFRSFTVCYEPARKWRRRQSIRNHQI